MEKKMQCGTRRFVVSLLVTVAVLSTVAGLLISRWGGDRGRQLQEQAVSGTQVSFTGRACPAGCVFLPMIAVNSGAGRQTSSEPLTAIDVFAHASAVCSDGSASPVAGARVTVTTDDDARSGVTDASGHARFEAVDEIVIVQIEWPAGYFPCPDSRPMVELPGGAGQVTFTASSPNYP